MINSRLCCLGLLLVLVGTDARAAAGRQITSGQHAQASTPALSPADAQKAFVLPAGFEARLFAAEPDVINPVAMTWDDRGRLWVVELYEYPLGAPAGTKPRDRIKILEDTDGDGKADKVTVFKDGLNLATGILLGNGGVYVGQAPNLLFLQDTNGDDKADTETVLMTGFGKEDRHELLNSFCWGPDGWMYLTHGVFTYSKVSDPTHPDDGEVKMNAAVARFQPRTKKFEVFADGTSNPWGVDFDRAGNAFVSACVIDHLFHMAAGGNYVRQGGTPSNPYAYQLLPSIVDHKHHMAAYAGVNVYQGSQYPREWQGEVIFGNIHQNALNHDHLTPNGSSFKATSQKDFLTTTDGWFMPVSTQTGPDGALWVMDWYDKYPCYQNAQADPEGVDREHGRIWRIVYVGDHPGAPVASRLERDMNLSKLSTPDLVQLLTHPNIWQRRMAQRLLTERNDPQAKELLINLTKSDSNPDSRLFALWTLHSAGQLDDNVLDALANSSESAMRTWVARFTGERHSPSDYALGRLQTLARDGDPSVRLAVATAARQLVSGALTINTPPSMPADSARITSLLRTVIQSSHDGTDPLIPFMVWTASEPIVAANLPENLDWFLKNGKANAPLSETLLTKTMRRLCDLPGTNQLDLAVDFLTQLPSDAPALILAALNGLVEGEKGKTTVPSKPITDLFARLSTSTDPKVVQRSQQLGATWGSVFAAKAIASRVNDPTASLEERLAGVKTAAQMKNDIAREALLQVMNTKNPDELVVEAIRSLADIGGDNVASELLKHWKEYAPAPRRALLEALASRRAWALPLMTAVQAGTISLGDLPVTVIRSLIQSPNTTVRDLAATFIGRFRDLTPAKKQLIADKRKVVASGAIDLQAGHELARKNCFVCHKLHGEGAEVGPDLTGVGRSSLDALLSNVIDPNLIIGKGYENVMVETKDGRSLSGRLVEDTDTRIKLLSAGPKEDVIAKSDITSRRVTEMSVMPEGLEQLPDNDFRNLIWYILAPPQDGHELTPKLRAQILGEETTAVSAPPPVETDGESIALWNPDWKVQCPKYEDAPKKLEYAGKVNVLMTHPFSPEKPAAVWRSVGVPAFAKSRFTFSVSSHEKGDWELRVVVDGKTIQHEIVDTKGKSWKQIEVDLAPYMGKTILLRLENATHEAGWGFGYWSDFSFTMQP